MSTVSTKRLIVGSLLCSVFVTGCVSQSKYDTLEAQNSELAAQNAQLAEQSASQSSQIASDKVRITRLQGAIKYTIDSDLLFRAGSWTMSDEGKEIVGKMAKKLAPTQENKLVVNGYTDNEPIGPTLEEQGVTSNQILSEKRAEAVKDYLISQGLEPDLVTTVGHGEANPIATNKTDNGRKQNRRVELSLGG